MRTTIQLRHARSAVAAAASAAALIVTVSIPALAATGTDLTAEGSSATINGAKFQALTSDDGNKRKGFHRFVSLGKGKIAEPEGYNTDYRAVQFDERGGRKDTHSLLLSDVPQVEVTATLYRAFELDVSQRASDGGPTAPRYLTLDELELYESPYAALCGYPFDGSGGGHAGCTSDNTATLVWNMDAAADSFVVLDYRNNPGKGRTDLRVLVPDALFNQSPNCDEGGVGCTVYVTLYSAFGGDSDGGSGNPLLAVAHPNNAGPESWGVR